MGSKRKTIDSFFTPADSAPKSKVAAHADSPKQPVHPSSPPQPVHPPKPAPTSPRQPLHPVSAPQHPVHPPSAGGASTSTRVDAGADPAAAPLSSLITEASWQPLVQRQSSQLYWSRLEKFVQRQRQAHTVFPPRDLTFRALNSVPLDSVRVVILGQDPYHGVGQAEGWSFSVPRGQAVPSSLKNIHKELASDLGCRVPRHGHLEDWVRQGVLLLNTSLTVEAHKAGSHAKQGWEQFTDAVIQHISDCRKGVVFVLWGKHAQCLVCEVEPFAQLDKVDTCRACSSALLDAARAVQSRKSKISTAKHTVLESAHPSGLSANRGFFGCKHFSKCNAALRKSGLQEIDWQITD